MQQFVLLAICNINDILMETDKKRDFLMLLTDINVPPLAGNVLKTNKCKEIVGYCLPTK